MGKRRHQQDKLWMAHTELPERKRDAHRGDRLERLPLDHCALTMRPFSTPVAAPDGSVFDLV